MRLGEAIGPIDRGSAEEIAKIRRLLDEGVGLTQVRAAHLQYLDDDKVQAVAVTERSWVTFELANPFDSSYSVQVDHLALSQLRSVRIKEDVTMSGGHTYRDIIAEVNFLDKTSFEVLENHRVYGSRDAARESLLKLLAELTGQSHSSSNEPLVSRGS